MDFFPLLNSKDFLSLSIKISSCSDFLTKVFVSYILQLYKYHCVSHSYCICFILTEITEEINMGADFYNPPISKPF